MSDGSWDQGWVYDPEQGTIRLGGQDLRRLTFDQIRSMVAVVSRISEDVQGLRLLHSLGQPHDIEGHSLHCSGSIGVAMYPDDGDSADELIKHADAAMFDSKGDGRNQVHFFSEESWERLARRFTLEAELRTAIEEKQFIIHYQPQVELAGNRISGAEALIRWKHPVRGIVPPLEFIPLAEELDRLVPLLRELVRWKVPISVDTYKPEVMQVALDLGVDIINDIWALRQPGATAVVAAHPSCGVCLMHMHRTPQTMQVTPMAGDVVEAVLNFLQARQQELLTLGVDARRLMLDPGIGFGKTVAQNFRLLAHQSDLLTLGTPLLAGWSRKSSLGAVLTKEGQVPEPAARQAASVAAALLAVERGASVVRVHDVKETVEALQVWQAMRSHA